ncbi:hypothetical protein B0H10DRAFT_531421 [Mycena sp. CBHHK59/15]|nr:hypothetical protein B0H10DRAFT_531421 [Mycena sp. CBHHK59/15]
MVTKTFPMPLGSPRRKHILTVIEIKVDSKDVEAVSEDPPRIVFFLWVTGAVVPSRLSLGYKGFPWLNPNSLMFSPGKDMCWNEFHAQHSNSLSVTGIVLEWVGAS